MILAGKLLKEARVDAGLTQTELAERLGASQPVVARLESGMAWAEDPPSHTCHLISNIAVLEGGPRTQVTVHSNFILYRTRGESEQDFYVGRRQDILRWSGSDWLLAYRKILLPQHVLAAKNASNFF